MIVRYATRSALLLAVTATPALAQTPPTTPPTTTTPAPPSDLSTAKIPVRDLGPVIAKSTHQFSNISSLRGLPDGGLFVNDNQRRQVVRLDATLQQVTIVSDTGAGAKFPYTQRQAGVLSYLGDSTIVVDPTTLSLVVLNPQGDPVRVMAPPRLNDMGQLTSQNIGGNAFDKQGRLIYKGSAFSGTNNAGFNTGGGFGGGGGGGGGGRGGPGGGGGPGGFGGGPGGGGGQPGGQGGPGGGNRGNNPLNQPDSLPILRADFDRRAADTVAFIKVPRTEMSMSTQPDGSMRSVAMINPLPQGDDWALMADGTVAVVRVLDYRVDFFAPDGSKSTSGKLPFDWKRITDAEKEKLVEELKVTAKEASDRAAQQGGGGANNRFRMTFEPVPASKLPDYVPPIRPGTTLADHDGNLWLLPMTSNVAAQIAQQLAAAQGGQGGRGGGMPGMGMPGMGGGGFPGGGGDRGGDRGGGGGGAGGGRGAGRAGAAGAADTAAVRRAAADSAGRANAPAPRAPAPFQLVYDVMNRKGELVERVKIPENRTILGFAPGGVVFLGYRDGRTMTIEVAKRPTN
ncbi:MAG: hypothetical protein V4617_14000 [Gemmatimonadota bacterium]